MKTWKHYHNQTSNSRSKCPKIPLSLPQTDSLTDQLHAHIVKSNPLLPKLLSSTTRPQTLTLFSHLLSHSSPNHQSLHFSLPSLLKSCSHLEEARQLHAQILKAHSHSDPYVSNSLLRTYFHLHQSEHATRVFSTMPRRDIISWNSMISGHVSAGDIATALRLFREMPRKDLVSCNAIVDGLTRSGMCDAAAELLHSMPRTDVVTWTAVVSGYVRSGRPEDALDTFRTMLRRGVRPDAAAVVNVLAAIADLGLAREGKWAHDYLRGGGVKLNSEVLGSALVDMYSKCGLVDDAYRVFRSVCRRKRLADWNSMINGFALHGLAGRAVEIFREMEALAIDPDDVTFLGILNACSHGGLVEEGCYYFELMKEKFCVVPRMQHYGCVINLYARAGLIDEAMGVVEEMRPMVPDAVAWKSLLSSCVKHGDWIRGELAAVNAIELDPGDSSAYVLLSNMYAKLGRWRDVDRVRALMRARGVRKVPGCSALMINGNVHEFLVGEDMVA